MAIVEGYYDPDDYNDPVKYRLNLEYIEYFTMNRLDEYIFNVQRHVVNMLDGSKTFFKTELATHNFLEGAVHRIHYSVFTLHPEFIQYDQYVDYRISPTTRRLNSNSSSKNDSIMPGYYFAFYIMSQLGGLYVFLHLMFGLLMNRWTEQHLKQTLMNELYSSIEAKSKSRNQALSQQTERNRSVKVSPDNVSPNLHMNGSHKNEQYPLINEQSVEMGNRVNQKDFMSSSNRIVKNQEPKINEFDNVSARNMDRNQSSHKSKSFYDFKDAIYGIFCCLNKGDKPDMITLKGRQALLNHQFSVLAYQRDIITILDNLNSVKNEVQSIEKKVGNNPIMVTRRHIDPKSPKPVKHSKFDQDIYEEQKELNDDSYSHLNGQNKDLAKSKTMPKAHNEHYKKRYKEKVKSINTIVNKETESLNKQKHYYMMKHSKTLKKDTNYDSYAKEQYQQHVSPSRDLSHVHGLNSIEKQVRQDIQNDYIEADEINDFENSQVQVQNQNEEVSFAEDDFEANKDGSYSQFWK